MFDWSKQQRPFLLIGPFVLGQPAPPDPTEFGHGFALVSVAVQGWLVTQWPFKQWSLMMYNIISMLTAEGDSGQII